MEVNKEKQLEDLIRKSVKEVGLESPSADFTKTLMSQIKVSAQSTSVTMYKPLISRAGWAILAIVVLALSFYALDHKLDIQMAWVEKMNLGALPKLHLKDVLPNLAISNIFLYSLLIFALFAVIQMVFLMQRLNREYS